MYTYVPIIITIIITREGLLVAEGGFFAGVCALSIPTGREMMGKKKEKKWKKSAFAATF